MKLFTCVIPGRTAIKKNSRKHIRIRGRTISVPSDAYVHWAKIASVHIIKSRSPGETIECQVNMCAVFYYKNKIRPDLSNAYQGVEDLLQSCGVLANDKLIASHDGSHFRTDPNERIEITLTKYEVKS